MYIITLTHLISIINLTHETKKIFWLQNSKKTFQICKNCSVEGSEGELALCAGDYMLVWGNGEPQGGYYDAELLDGRRGLVPASFVQRLVGK